MPTSGVAKRARSVAMRRSQLAANSSAPPMQTPSMAARTGTGAASVARVTRWKARDRRRPRLAAWRRCAAKRSSPAEKCSPAPRATTQRTASSAPAASIASAIASIVSRVQALRLAWRSQRHHARRAAQRDGHASVRSMACSGSSSPRAVRYTTRVFCSPTGSVPGATRLYLEARAAARRAAPRRRASIAVRPSRRRRAAAGRSGRRRPPPRSGPAPSKRPSTAPIAPGWTLTACTRSMSSRRPSMRMRSAVRPHAHGDVHTRARSPER